MLKHACVPHGLPSSALLHVQVRYKTVTAFH